MKRTLEYIGWYLIFLGIYLLGYQKGLLDAETESSTTIYAVPVKSPERNGGNTTDQERVDGQSVHESQKD